MRDREHIINYSDVILIVLKYLLAHIIILSAILCCALNGKYSQYE